MTRVFLFLCLIFPIPAMAANVVVTIKPLHSLALMIMEHSGNEPILLVDGAQSMHSFSLKPSQVTQIQKADSVFFISHDLEMFVNAVLDNAPKTLHRIAMAEQKDIHLLPVRLGHGFDEHHHEGVHAHEHENETSDLHLWSSPENAKAMLNIIASELIRIDPVQQTLYEANLYRALKRIDAMDANLKTRMEKLADKPFVTFHDATQYFEQAYHLHAVGSLTLHPERGTSAKHISEVQQKIHGTNAICVFREPQFEDKIISQLLQDTKVKSQMIDPEASQLIPSPHLYFEMMEGIAKSFEACLG